MGNALGGKNPLFLLVQENILVLKAAFFVQWRKERYSVNQLPGGDIWIQQLVCFVWHFLVSDDQNRQSRGCPFQRRYQIQRRLVIKNTISRDLLFRHFLGVCRLREYK